MLATLRQAETESKNYWQVNGELGRIMEATVIFDTGLKHQEGVFFGFLKDGVVDSSTIESFQKLLESLRFIEVKYPKGTQSDEASQYWHTDGTIWSIRGNESSEPSAPIDDFSDFRELLDLLIAMPDKYVSPTAQRHREIYYYHAHLLVPRIIRSRGLLEQHPLFLMKAVFVVLQLLTHRYQIGDSLLLDFVRDNSVRSDHPNMNVMLLWAELKEKAFRKDYGGLCTIRDRALNLMNSNEVQSHTTPRQNGFLGFVLVDLAKNATALNFEDLVADALKAGTKWIDSAQSTGTSIEKTALCEMLATFDIHARKEIIQKEYYLFYGYHLSRAGFLEQGDQFLARGLKSRDSPRLWSYEMERVSNALRLGRQNEAAQMLKTIRELALRHRDMDYSNLWNHSGECAETFVLLYLYEADCSTSAGRLDDACAKLKSGIGITSFVYDAYIRILRITLEMRLLEILMRHGSLLEALPVALNLASEILDERTSSALAPDVVYGIVQQSVDLSNILFSAGNVAASIELLESMTGLGSRLPSELSKEIKSHVEQRMAKARQFYRTIEFSGRDQTPRALNTGIGDPITLVRTDPNPKMPKAIEEGALMSGALEAASSRKSRRLGVEDPKSLVQTDPNYDPIIPNAKETTVPISASLRQPSSSKARMTSIGDPITQVQSDSKYDPTVPKRQETTVLANASLDPNSSYRNPPKLPNPNKLQSKAQKFRERDKQSSSKAFHSKTYASTLGKLRRAPRPPSTEPDKFESASGEKIMQEEETPSRIEVKPRVIVPGMP